MMESARKESGGSPENVVPRTMRRFVDAVWRDILTGILAGIEIAYIWTCFFGPFAHGAWRAVALSLPNKIYQTTPRLWLLILIALLSLVFFAPDLNRFRVRFCRTWQAENFQGNVVIWMVLSCVGAFSFLSGNRVAFAVAILIAIALTAVEYNVVRRRQGKEGALPPVS